MHKPGRFSFLETPPLKQQRSCYLTYTNEHAHDILREGFDESPLFTGRIMGSGPRYCPSIEDKIERFSSRNRHQLFIEPEGWTSNEYYVNGFSSSLPHDIQYRALRQIEGFTEARILKPGYAIEYDYFPPTQLFMTLESRMIQYLYFAGQVNGTTGYEEAAGQGLMAGINAHLKIHEKEPFILKRHEAYIGVLIDDLITKGTNEPYRMFTSRAEFRILLRQDNADVRLTPYGYTLGLAGEERMQRLERKLEIQHDIMDYMAMHNADPDEINDYLLACETSPMERKSKLAHVLLRPQVSLMGLMRADKALGSFVHGYSGEAVFRSALNQQRYSLSMPGILKRKEILLKR
jgi:tRNA uridine 5-carboxymethylaminomethyl modification enzyme